MNPLLVLLAAQILYGMSDLLGRYGMRQGSFNLQIFIQPWFYAFLVLHFVALMLQLYVFASFELGKTITLLAVTGVLLSIVLGWLFLGEKLSVGVYVAAILAIVAFIFLAYTKTQ